MCPWNEQGCAKNNEKGDFSQEYDDSEDVSDEPGDAISEVLDSAETSSIIWKRQLNAFDGMLEDENYRESYIRDDDGQGGRKRPFVNLH